jgi:diguanylate cyclase (GGDEF)-like protein
MDLNTISTIVQVAIITLVAALLHELTRVMNLRFLSYWSRGWIALAIALCALLGAFRLQQTHNDTNAGTVALLAIYCFAEYVFGYLLWAGCHNYHSGRTIGHFQLRTMAMFAALAIGLAIAFPDFNRLFPCHAAIMACFFAISAIECRLPPQETRAVGVRVLRLALFSLAVLFGHYTLVVGFFLHYMPDLPMVHMQYSSLYDATLEVGMAFGMILLATERIRRELEVKNHRLAIAADALAKSAITDPLTGLLNRLAFEELRNDPTPLGTSGAVAVIDLNDLKPLNDLFGHRTGDIALQIVARALRVHSRVTDPIYRLGGDEFAIVMPDCSVDDLTHRLSQIDAALLSQRFPGIDSPQDVRIAWGCTAYDSPAEFAAAVAIADQHMYSQKKDRKGSVRSRDEILV